MIMEKSDLERKNVSKKVALDVTVFCIMGVFLMVFELRFIEPFHKGFFCDDQSIRYPLQPSTFSSLVALLMGVGIPAAVISTIEYVLFYRRKQYTPEISGTLPLSFPTASYIILNKNVPPYFAALYQYIGCLFLASGLGAITTDIIKNALGGLRPHFLAVCNPNWNIVNCTDGHGNIRYIVEDVCQNEDVSELIDARLTFPSGHANIAFAGFVYLVLYIQARMRWRGSHLLKHCIQALALFLAVYMAATRVSDYQHHMSDVIAGAFIGTAAAVFAAFCVSDLFVMHQARYLVDSLKRDVESIAHNYSRMDSNTTTGTGFASESVDLEDIVFTSI